MYKASLTAVLATLIGSSLWAQEMKLNSNNATSLEVNLTPEAVEFQPAPIKLNFDLSVLKDNISHVETNTSEVIRARNALVTKSIDLDKNIIHLTQNMALVSKTLSQLVPLVDSLVTNQNNLKGKLKDTINGKKSLDEKIDILDVAISNLRSCVYTPASGNFITIKAKANGKPFNFEE
jgi:peptidoglycan hydrolase CwlO-like protein